MATHNITFWVTDDGDFNLLFAGGTGSSGNRVDLTQGDTVNFTHTTDGNVTANIVVRSFLASQWSASSDLTVSRGSTLSRTILANATVATDDLIIDPDYAATGSKTAYLNIVSNVDSTPDQFTFTDTSGANPGGTYSANSITLAGINAAVNASITSGLGTFSVNYEGSYTSRTVSVGDKILVSLNSSASYSTSVSTVLNVGGVQDTYTVTTRVAPDSGQKISSGITLSNCKLSNVISFFAGSGGPNNMRSYLKNDVYVPNITENNSIPATGTLQLLDFLDCYTSFYFETLPDSMVKGGYNTINGGTYTSYSSQSAGVDFELGFGSRMKEAAEYKLEFLSQNIEGNGGAAGDVIFSRNTPTAWTNDNRHISIEVTVVGSIERSYDGWIRVYVRHPIDPLVIITSDVYYRFMFYGP